MSAPPLKDELSFSDAPKMVGERNPDSVLFKIGDLVGDEEAKPAARGKNEVFEEIPADEKPAPAARVIETEAQKKGASSGLINVHNLLDEEAEAANAVPKQVINPGLIPEAPPPSPAVVQVAEPAAPPSKMPVMVLLAAGLAVIVAALAVAATIG